MIIQRLDVFFRTQLTFDTPNTFNSVTNVLFAPLQHLIGQHKYQSLQGRVSPLSPTSSVDYGNTARRVISVFALMLAVVLTPFGIATRYLSFRSPEVSEAYSIVSVFTLTDAEYKQQRPHLSLNQIDAYRALKVEREKKASLDSYLKLAIQSLETLESGLKAKGAQDSWAAEYLNDPLYPFPFHMAQQLEGNPKIVARADKALWDRLIALRQTCLELLAPTGGIWNEGELQENLKNQAMGTFKHAFVINGLFLKELKSKLDRNIETPDLSSWMGDQILLPNYPFPFYTQPRVLEFLDQSTDDPTITEQYVNIFTFCRHALQERGLEDYINKKPPEGHQPINLLIQELKRLKNITSFQNLIKNQST